MLDEICALPLDFQSALLRVIDTKRVRPVGSEREVPIDVRFVFSDNSDVRKAVDQGRFRADLFYRINVLHIVMPPLRERLEDIAVLTDKFMNELSFELGVRPLKLTSAIRRGLSRYDWPGNIHELRNVVERSLILGEFAPGFAVAFDDGPDRDDETLKAVEEQHIRKILSEVDGNRAEAARRLGVSRKTIDRKCAKWND